ncbi:MbnP family protein [Flavobacterium sp.]|uniref:MbnP family protein n=1 Tax=Flavobacterium sp. TaxID=239 RepID=UPI0028BD5984|nr:MbnP family protein [Flavobacterium sp.]
MQLKNLVAALAMATALVSCNQDDNNQVSTTEKGNLNVEFDNVFNGADLILNTQVNTTSLNENLKVGLVKYIVSNIVLTKADGTTFTYPTADGYFIVNESDAASRVLQLQDIPAGDYTSIQFGIGVDQEHFNLGAGGQGDFLAHAQNEDMLWSWSAGYKFVAFEGTFTSATVASDTSFMVHTGQTGTAYNYKVITLAMPDNALVRSTITPQIHIMADVSKLIDGTNKISLTNNNMGGMGTMIMGGTNLELITSNLTNMFSVHHVHND